MSAIRLARGATRRDRILKFAGCYHGHADALLAEAGLRARRRSASRRPRASRRGATADTIVAPYNDIEAAARRRRALRRGPRLRDRRAGRREHGRRPARARLPRGAARALRRLGRAARLRRGDHRLPHRARRRAGALRRARGPDGARQDRRRRPADRRLRRPRRTSWSTSRRSATSTRRARSRGTRSRRPRGSRSSAGCGDPAVYEELERKAARLEAGPGAVRRLPAGRRHVHPLPSTRVSPIKNFAEASACDTARYGEYFRHMLERGIYVPPSQFEAMFVSLAHGDEEIDRTVEAAAEFFAAS